MVTREQVAAAISHVVFVAGLALVVVGTVAGDLPRLAHIGGGISIGVMPFVILARVRRHTAITRETAESLRREGYRLGLEHAGRGLLKPPPDTDDGEGAPSTNGATVHRLYLVDPDDQQRRAQ
ncbi:hypothetical protein ACWGIN_20065 [Streptomyces sp. NPDC054861]